MERNKMKIIYCSKDNTLAFYFHNERGEWIAVSNSSPLSRKKYQNGTLKENASDVIRLINEIYNYNNRGVDIIFEGTSCQYQLLQKEISALSPTHSITCKMSTTTILVAGKTASGKTMLIKSLAPNAEKKAHSNSFDVFVESSRGLKWIELRGIDLGKENVESAKRVINKLAAHNISTFLYCISTRKIESVEELLIAELKKEHPEIKIILVATNSIDDTAENTAEQIKSQLTIPIEVIPVLAKEFRTRQGVIPSYGMEKLYAHIFRGD